MLKSLARNLTKNKLADKIASELILPNIRLLAQFCENVEIEDGGPDLDAILDGHESDIENWVARDGDSLRAWLRQVLGLEKMTKAEIAKQFSAYLPDEEDMEDNLP
jgi:hypothetical protein